MIKYHANITAIGPLVSEFIEADILVLFGSNAPEELAEFSVLHDGTELAGTLAPGDTVLLGDHRFGVLAVGDVASTNLANLGHLVLKFNGETEAEMPGDVCVEKKPIPPLELGMVVQVEGA
jgi:PTS system glucitol/sorbitol-specific IIA component